MKGEELLKLRAVAIEPTYLNPRREKLDVARIVALIADLGANCIRLGAYSHNGRAYYPFKIVPRYRPAFYYIDCFQLMPGCSCRFCPTRFKREIHSISPVKGCSIALRLPHVKRARALVAGKLLKTTRSQGALQVSLPTIGPHEVVHVRCQ